MNSTLPGRLFAGGLLVLVAAGLAAAPLAFGGPPTVLPFDISGQWKGTAKTQGASGGITFFLLQTGTNISGTVKVNNSFIKDCDPVTGTITQGAFQDGLFHVQMQTPHVNPFTCAVTGSDFPEVDLPLSSNIKMAGSFEHFLQELNDGEGGFITIQLALTKKSGLITENDPDGPGPAVDLGSSLPGVHDLAVTKLVVPKTVTLTATKPTVTSKVKVEIQNRSQHDETINDMTVLSDLVTLTCTPLGGTCTAPVPVLHAGKPQKTLPVTLKPKQKLTVHFDVTFDCAFDPAKTVGQSFHGDYTWSAEVDHEALGAPDDHEADDVCPRNAAAPYDFDHYPDGTIKDKGCGAKLSDGTFGGTQVTDVVVK